MLLRVFSLILKTFQVRRLTNWSNDMQRSSGSGAVWLLLHDAVRSSWDWTERTERLRDVTKTFRLSPVPVSGPDILQVHRSHKALWCWEHSTQKYSFYRHLWSFVIAFLYSNSPTSWLRSIIVKPKMEPVGPAGPKLLTELANVDLTRWKVRLSGCQPL